VLGLVPDGGVDYGKGHAADVDHCDHRRALSRGPVLERLPRHQLRLRVGRDHLPAHRSDRDDRAGGETNRRPRASCASQMGGSLGLFTTVDATTGAVTT